MVHSNGCSPAPAATSVLLSLCRILMPRCHQITSVGRARHKGAVGPPAGRCWRSGPSQWGILDRDQRFGVEFRGGEDVRRLQSTLDSTRHWD